jgi:hypothetical protein
VLVSTGVIITFLLAVFVIGWFIGSVDERRRGTGGEELPGNRAALASGDHSATRVMQDNR